MSAIQEDTQTYGKEPVSLAVSWIDPVTGVARLTVRGEYSIDYVGHREGQTDIVLKPGK